MVILEGAFIFLNSRNVYWVYKICSKTNKTRAQQIFQASVKRFGLRIYQMAATNGQVAKRSLADSGISAAGFLSGPEESACSLSNWITGLFPHFKGLWTQQRSCMMKSKWQLKWEGEKQQEFLESPLASARQLTREMRNQWSLLRRVTGISFQWCEIRERSASHGGRGKHLPDLLERCRTT